MLKTYAVCSSLALAFLAGAAFQTSQKPHFNEIDVERINVVERDGRVRLVIANSERQAVSVVDGKELLPRRKRDAGLMFFNDVGDENGGLTYSGRVENGVPTADAGLSFDQFKQDETVTLRYAQSGTKRQAGLTVADRPEQSLAAVARLNDATTDERRAAIRQQLVDEGVLENRQRMFVGKDTDGTSKLVLSDAHAKPRLVLSVTADGSARVQFLDASGKTVKEIQP